MKHIKELQRTVDMLPLLEPEQLNMEQWKCGTSACLAGWCATINPDSELKLKKISDGWNHYWEIRYKQYTDIEACQHYFDITEKEVERIFIPSRKKDKEGDWAALTIKQVASRTQRFINRKTRKQK